MAGQQKDGEGKSIQSRLVLLLLFILIPVLAVQAYMYHDSYRTRRASELQANLEIARAVANTFESFVEDVLHHELVIGLALTSSQPMTHGDITRLLTSSQGYLAVRDFTWMNPNGDAVYSGNPAVVGRNYGDRSYIREIVNGREWTVSELLVSRATGKPVFGISRGIRDEKGKLLGIVVAMIIPEQLDARLAVERSKGGGHALVDHKGMMVYRYPAINATWEERNWLKQYPEFGEALGGQEVTATVHAPFEGKNRLVSFTPVPSIGWAASAGRTEEEVINPILGSIAENALLFLCVSLAAFFIALAFSRKIASPVAALRAHAVALGNGQEPTLVGPEGISEFRDLAEAFNVMAEKVRARELDLQQTEERLRTAQKYGGVGVWAWDVRTGHVVWEPELEELYGWPPGIARSYQDWASHVHPEDLARIEVERDTALRDRIPFHLEFRIRHTSGDERWMLSKGRGEYDSSGQLHRVLGVNLDITDRKRAEEELQKLASVVRHTNELINVAALDGKMVFLNEAGAEMVGLSAEEVGQTHILQVIPRHLQDKVRDEVLPTLLEKGFWRGELQYLNLKTGRLTDVYATTFTVKDPDKGTPLYLANTSIDITDRKRAEEALQEQIERYRLVVDGSQGAIWDWDVPNKRVFLSPQWKQMRGYAGDEVGENETEWSNGIHPDDAPRVFAAVQAHFEGKTPVFAEEYRIRCKDGTWKWISDRGLAQFDSAGRVVRMAGSETDITERNRLEEEARKLLATVQAEKDRLSALINSMNDEVWFADTDKRFSLANPRGLQEFGMVAVNGIDVEKMAAGLEVYRPDGTPRPVEEAPPLRALRGEVVRNQEEIIRTPSGSELRYREVNAAPVRDAGGNIIGSISVVRDITDRKKAEIDLRNSEEALRLANEQLEQRVRERTMDLQNLAEQLERSHQSLRKLASELVMAEERERKRVAGVLHDDIAQTLAAAKMRIDMLQGASSDPQDRWALQEAKGLLLQSIQETRALMNEIGNPLLFDMGLQAACESLANRLMEKYPVRIHCNIGDSYKHLNPDMKTILYQVFRELLNNVVKHSQAQNAHVMIDVEDGHFRLRVTDDGAGFDPQTVGAPSFEGGYGLYSIRERLLAVGGSLRIESTPGTGTVVTAILPPALD